VKAASIRKPLRALALSLGLLAMACDLGPTPLVIKDGCTTAPGPDPMIGCPIPSELRSPEPSASK